MADWAERAMLANDRGAIASRPALKGADRAALGARSMPLEWSSTLTQFGLRTRRQSWPWR